MGAVFLVGNPLDFSDEIAVFDYLNDFESLISDLAVFPRLALCEVSFGCCYGAEDGGVPDVRSPTSFSFVPVKIRAC